MKLFNFDPQGYSAAYAEHGFVHIRRGLTDQFYQVLRAQVDEYLHSRRLEKFALGDKQQSLYQFPQDWDCFGQLLDGVAGVCGLDRTALILSERHIKAYDLNANPHPLAHKDRYGSEVSVGFSVTVPETSKLVLYPYDDVSINPYDSSAELRTSLAPEALPEVTLKNARRVELSDTAGDVVMFRGNAIWHLRSHPAGTTMLYLKLNTFNSDPLGEDPRHEFGASESLELAAAEHSA
jgi:hypothetical protein